jgi:uncharacterized protein YecA (UPF0149 family)
MSSTNASGPDQIQGQLKALTDQVNATVENASRNLDAVKELLAAAGVEEFDDFQSEVMKWVGEISDEVGKLKQDFKTTVAALITNQAVINESIMAMQRQFVIIRDALVKAQSESEHLPPASRNDPCPCGSGKKYKKCHGAPASAVSTDDL